MAIAASLLLLCAVRCGSHGSELAARPWARERNAVAKRLAKGESISTDAQSQARLNLNDVGEVEIEPNTKLSVLAIRPDEQRLALDHGTIHALIWAPPGPVRRKYAVGANGGSRLPVHAESGSDGVGLVEVSVGWVAFENEGRESFIPAGAACLTRPGKGPGIPYYQDASARTDQRDPSVRRGCGPAAYRRRSWKKPAREMQSASGICCAGSSRTIAAASTIACRNLSLCLPA